VAAILDERQAFVSAVGVVHVIDDGGECGNHRVAMFTWLRRSYCAVDPRTLGLVRIVLGILLLIDLAKRSCVLSLFYTNDGLIPNHRSLWQPLREYSFSFLFAFSRASEVRWVFAFIAVVYLCFLLGYRTRLMHALSWICLMSLELRVDMLSSGADFVFTQLLLWTAFLPMGRRFSVDSLRASLRLPNASFEDLARRAAALRPTEPVVSLAFLAATLQLSVIYAFNTIAKNGSTWHDGSAVWWLVHQERIVTYLGLFAREHLPIWFFQGLSYGTLVIEGALPLLILSPWGRPWTRRAVIVLVVGLHGGMALLSNLGMFSPVMMAFSLLFLSRQDWEAWERRGQARPSLRVYVEETTGVCWQAARLWVRLDLFRRSQLQPMAAIALTGEHGGYAVERSDGTRLVLEPALRCLVSVLPFGFLWRILAGALRPISAPLLRRIGRERTLWSRELGLAPMAAASALPSTSSAPLVQKLSRLRAGARELAVAWLMVVATSQVLNENASIPEFLKHSQPRLIRASVDYFRLNQGWSMFAPDAPTWDRALVIDAVTQDGRHIDPYNQLASRVPDPSLRTIPKRLGYAAAYCDYAAAIVDNPLMHEPLHEWILNYHRRTRRKQDRIERYDAYVIEQESPAPGEDTPRAVTARVFLRERRKPAHRGREH